MNTDRTLLMQTNLKAEVQLFKGSRLSIFNNFNKKERNARGASDLNPIETTTPQKAVDKSFGKYLWNTGPNPTYKFGNQWVISDRLLVDVQYAHIGNNFTLGLQSPDLRDHAAHARGRHRHERPLGGGERLHPPGQQPNLQLDLLPPGSSAAITRSRSAATGAIRTPRRSTTRVATRQCVSRRVDRRNDCPLPRPEICQVRSHP